MNNNNNSNRLDVLLKKQEMLKNQIASVQARQRKEEDRKLTRMKILAGAFLIEQHKENISELSCKLDSFLTRKNDRLLFGLTPLEEQ